LLIQPFDCRPLLPISGYSGDFAPDFAPEIDLWVANSKFGRFRAVSIWIRFFH
jgi:hypothetical protein